MRFLHFKDKDQGRYLFRLWRDHFNKIITTESIYLKKEHITDVKESHPRL